jgi:hypothetical protein
MTYRWNKHFICQRNYVEGNNIAYIIWIIFRMLVKVDLSIS